MKLYKTKENNTELLIEQLELADRFLSRAKGLLGRKKIDSTEALWIRPCRDIHTFFMNFAIDCVFLDEKMKIIKIAADVKPFKLVGPYWKADSVIEFQSGFVEQKKLEVGDHLYVVR